MLKLVRSIVSGKGMPQAGVPEAMPIIVGSPRSGTTLLRFMLDSHPDLSIPPETGFLLLGEELGAGGECSWERFANAVTTYPPESPAWPDFGIPEDSFRRELGRLRPFSVAEGFRLFYRMYAERFGKPRYGDKTPTYCQHLQSLEHLLPEARFIHLVRDGRDVAVSLRRRWFSPGHDIAIQAQFWRSNVEAARLQGAGCRHYLELRYEDLLRNPEVILRRICSFLGLTYHPAMLVYHERTPKRLQEHRGRARADGSVVVTAEERLRQQELTTQPPDLSRIGVWQQSLTPEESRQFEELAGDLLRDLGYLQGPKAKPDHRS
jgi:hypothetical protein